MGRRVQLTIVITPRFVNSPDLLFRAFGGAGGCPSRMYRNTRRYKVRLNILLRRLLSTTLTQWRILPVKAR